VTIPPIIPPPLERPDQLTPRTREIVELIVEGWSHPDIAAKLGIKRNTVAQAVHQLGRRLPGRGTPIVKLIRWWFRFHPPFPPQ
jgi:DNA-binding NarL/FixJ family response regulator